MNEKNISLKDKVWGHFKDIQAVFLATADGDQPKVRPVTLLYYNDRLWIGTGTNAAKIKQIKENKKVEFCLFIEEEEKSGYIRATSEALIVHDNETRKLLAEKCLISGIFGKAQMIQITLCWSLWSKRLSI